jgi:hypothetical protein
MFEHVATYRINYLPFARLVHNVDHAGLLLVAFRPLAVQIVQIESNAGA